MQTCVPARLQYNMGFDMASSPYVGYINNLQT